MRRLALLGLLVPALAASGCGGDKGGSGPLDEGLRYLPADAPFAVAIDTDLKGDQYRVAGKIADRFAFAGQGEDELKKMFETGDVDFDRDVKPLLGNPFVVGAPDSRHFDRDSFVGAIEVKDGDKLKDLVARAGADQKGEKAGAKLYEDRTGDTYAIEDDALVVAGSRQLLEDALDRHDGKGTLTEDKFDSALEGLPDAGLVRTYVNIEALLKARPGGRRAMRIEWVGALRTLGLVAQARDDSVVVPFDLTTDPDGLSDKDLPVATGNAAPKLVQRAGELGIGVRDAGQTVQFALDAARATEGPAVDVGETQLQHQLGIDIEDDIISQLHNDTSIVVTPSGGYGVRAALRDPAAFRKTLAKAASALPRLVETFGGQPVELSKPGRGRDFYTLAQPDGTSVVFGVSRRMLVISTDPRSARRLAAATPIGVPGAKGSLVMSADAQKLANAILGRVPLFGLLGSFGFTEPLGDLTGAARTTTSGMKGSLELKFD